MSDTPCKIRPNLRSSGDEEVSWSRAACPSGIYVAKRRGCRYIRRVGVVVGTEPML
jgi:hypothetical protein